MLCFTFSGEKISPLEIDAVLLAHPAVSEAVAFAAPDEHFGEEVCEESCFCDFVEEWLIHDVVCGDSLL